MGRKKNNDNNWKFKDGMRRERTCILRTQYPPESALHFNFLFGRVPFLHSFSDGMVFMDWWIGFEPPCLFSPLLSLLLGCTEKGRVCESAFFLRPSLGWGEGKGVRCIIFWWKCTTTSLVWAGLGWLAVNEWDWDGALYQLFWLEEWKRWMGAWGGKDAIEQVQDT